MTIKQLISAKYSIRHTREGGYPGAKMAFYDFIEIKSVLIRLDRKDDQLYF